MFLIQLQRQLGGPHIAGPHQDRGEIDGAQVVVVLGDLPAIDPKRAGRGVDDGIRLVSAAFQCSGHHERLDARSGLEDVRDRAVPVAGRIVLSAVVRVIGRLVRHRQHFARGRVQDHCRTRDGVIVGDGLLQFAISQVLEPEIQAGPQVPAGPGRLDQFHVFDDASQAVAKHPLGAMFSLEPIVEFELQTFLSHIVDVGKAEQMSDHLARRVVTPVLAKRRHSGHTQLQYSCGMFRRQVPAQVDELPFQVAGDAPYKPILVHLQDLRQFGQAMQGRRQVRGIRPDTVYRSADGQRFTVSVGDRAPVRGDLHRTQGPIVALRGEEFPLVELQVEDAALQHQSTADESQNDQRSAPPLPLHLLGFPGWIHESGSATSMISSASTCLRLSRSRAIASISPCVAHVLSSS